MSSYRLRLIFRTVIQNLIGLPPFIFFAYFIVLGLLSLSISHPGFWGLLFLCTIWVYFFTAEGLLLLYGLLKFDCVTRNRKELDDCLSELLETLDKNAIHYGVRRLIRCRIVRTNFGSILLVGVFYHMHPHFLSEYTVIFYPKSLKDVIEFEMVWSEPTKC